MATNCENCGKDFESKRNDARFCSDACRKAYKRVENELIPDGIIPDGVSVPAENGIFNPDKSINLHEHPNRFWGGILIRGQHDDDVPPSRQGLEWGKCWHCERRFSRWIEAKLAWLVRAELEGTPNIKEWGPRDGFDRQEFDRRKKQRMVEVRFCCDACQKAFVPRDDWRHLKPKTTEVTPDAKNGQNGKSDSHVTPKRRGS